ncbi:MAG: hypothetical protein CENE_00400 [Candidatus Celerinatantimonas neptuna]|nr:MAG: hypothetical protein CENE_00400 [Candidatus Celerinatantimonas neptuna]
MIFYPSIGIESDKLRDPILTKLRVFFGLLITLLVVVTICYLPIMATMIGGGWQDAYSLQMLWVVATGISAGSCWGVSLFGCLILLSRVWINQYHRFIALLGSAFMLVSLSLTGHTRFEEG